MLDITDGQKYDESVDKADAIYSGMMHNICWYLFIHLLIYYYSNNCHSHVARALNKYGYNGKTNHTMIDVWWLMCTQSKYVR
jgi:hypothetical protein